jgi:hypothetical protein
MCIHARFTNGLQAAAQPATIPSSALPSGTYPYAIKTGAIDSKSDNNNNSLKTIAARTRRLCDASGASKIEAPVPRTCWAIPQHFLALTAVSKQIHGETALLQFSQDEFGSRYVSRFVTFVSSLESQQRNAIAKVHLMVRDCFTFRPKPLWPVLHSLCGLKCVVVEKWTHNDEVNDLAIELTVRQVKARLSGKDVRVEHEIVEYEDA